MGGVEELESRRLLAAGALDTFFGGDGTVTIPDVDGNPLSAADVAVQADGKTVVVGQSHTTIGRDRFVTARFNVDGTLDTTFADAGIARQQLSDRGSSAARAVAIAPDGKIVVVGESDVGTGGGEKNLAVVRYNTDGSLDNSFSGNGKLSVDLNSDDSPAEVRDVAVSPSGQIAVVGKVGHSTHIPGLPLFFGDISDDFVVAVIDSDGELLIVEPVGFGEDDGARAVKFDAAGRLLVVGDVISGGTVPATRVGLVRLSPGSGGAIHRDFEEIYALPGRTRTLVQDVIPQGGKTLIAGHTLTAPGNRDFFVARFTETGALDTTFADGMGFRITDLGGDDLVGGMITAPAGAGGFLVSGRSGDGAWVAVKYTENGALDTTFGTGGVARVPEGGRGIPGIAAGPGRRVVLGGGDPSSGIVAVRLLLGDANIVTAAALDPSAQEGTPNSGTLFVGRTERLPFPTRVFLNVSGTASFSNDRSLPRDYSIPGLVVPIAGTPYVDIPANETFVLLTLTPIKDSRAEGTETAVFAIAPRSSYQVGTPGSGTIRIADAPQFILSVVGATTVTRPPRRVAAGRELRTEVTWTVPSGGWRGLSSIQLRLRDLRRRGAAALLTFDEPTNSFALAAASTRWAPVRLVPGSSTFRAAGAASPTVTVTFAYRFTAAAARRRFALEVAAGNDAGEFSGFTRVGRSFVIGKTPRKQADSLSGGKAIDLFD